MSFVIQLLESLKSGLILDIQDSDLDRLLSMRSEFRPPPTYKFVRDCRLTFSRNLQDSTFRSAAQKYIVILYRKKSDDLPQHPRTARTNYSQSSYVCEPASERGSERLVVQPSYSYEAPAMEAQSQRLIAGQVLSVQYVQDNLSRYTTVLPPVSAYTSTEWQDTS